MREHYQSFSNHIIILGWSTRVGRILAELREDELRAAGDFKPVLIVAEDFSQSIRVDYDRVYVIYGNPENQEVLTRACIDTADALLIPIQSASESGSSENVFAMLSALDLNPQLRICVEVSRTVHGRILQRIANSALRHSNLEIVSFESLAERLLAQAAINAGICNVYNSLLSFGDDSDELYVCNVGSEWIGRTFRDMFLRCFDSNIILLGYVDEHARLLLNPKDREHTFSAKDRVWFMADNKAIGMRVIAPERLPAGE